MRPKLSLIILALAAIFLSILLSQRESAPKNLLINEKINLSSIAVESTELKPPPPTNLKIQSALARQLAGSNIFFELNTQQRWPIASLTKLMTAIVALEELEDSSRVSNLVKKMILVSDNSAAEELSQTIGNENFVKLMNEKALKLGMIQTSFFEPTGLSFLNQSTVWDLDKLVTYIARRHPNVLQWSREPKLVVDGMSLTNINQFAGLPNFLGGKTGYTDDANGNLISIFSVGQTPVEIIVLGTADQAQRFEQTKILLEWISQYYKL